MSYIQESILKYLRNTTKEIGNISRRNRKCKMDGTLEKRRRSLNFHAQEIDILLALINLDKTTIECKKTDQITNSYKDMAWKKIAYTFNQKTSTKRSDKQLRSKWESLKKNARKDYAAETLTPLSEKVSKILDWGNDNETDMELGTSMKFKEEPYFNEVTYEENESEMDQWSPSDFQTNQNSSETVFQPKVQENIDINAEEKMVFHKLTAKEIQPNIDEIQLDQNVTHARPVTIASAFAAPSGKFNNEFLISGYPIHEKSPNKETTIHPILEPVITKVSRGVQCERRRRVHRQSFCHHTTNNNGLIALQKRLLIEENRRKKQKHETEMEILKIELQIKKKQLNDLEKL